MIGQRSRYGVTLIELIVVLAITAVLLGVGVASIKPRDQVQVDQFVRQLPGWVQKARYDAIVRNTFTRLVVDAGGVSLDVDTNPILEVQEYSAYDAVTAGGPGFEQVAVDAGGGSGILEFEPRGIVRGAAFQIVVRSAANPGYAYRVSVTAQGRVSWVRL